MRCTDRKRFVYGLVGIAIAGCAPQPVRPPAVPEAPAQARPPAPPATAITLPTPETARSWEQLRLQAARRMIAASPQGSYTSVAPEVLLAIPVLEIELNADGSVTYTPAANYFGADSFTFTVNDGGVHGGGQFLKQIADGQNQCVVDGISLLGARQTDDGHFFLVAVNVEMDVFGCHGEGSSVE